jgi:toxin ParE1/3/4
MARLQLTSNALEDLNEIHDFGIASFGLKAAETYSRGLQKAFDLLEFYPHSAPARPDIGEGMRCRVYREHLIIHSVEGDEVLVVRVLHHARDLTNALDK